MGEGHQWMRIQWSYDKNNNKQRDKEARPAGIDKIRISFNLTGQALKES